MISKGGVLTRILLFLLRRIYNVYNETTERIDMDLYTYEEIIALSKEEFAKNWTKVAVSSMNLLGYEPENPEAIETIETEDDSKGEA